MKTLKIEVNLDNIEEIYHPWNKNTLNPTLVTYLYDECLGKNKKSKIDIHIYTNDLLTTLQKEEIRKIIHVHFKEEQKEIKLKKQVSHLFHFVMLGMGLFFLFLSFLFKIQLVEEVLLILGWILIWEVVENLLFEKSKENLRLKRYKELGSARIYFKEDD